MDVVADNQDARRLSLLGIVLQVLHLLFGFTAIMGFIINMVLQHKAKGSVYESQIRWQQWTFLIGLVGYIIGFFIAQKTDNQWALLVVGLFILYRVATSIYYWIKRAPIPRLL